MSAGLSIRFDLRAPGLDGAALTDFYGAALDMCEWADRLGFQMVTLSEHHGSEDGYLPSSVVMAAAIAARTKSMRINIWAMPAPFHDPLRLAEDLAVADIISGGRMGVAITGGYVPSEFEMFGRRLAERPKAVAETIETLRRAWTGERFDFRGRTAQVRPRPVQRPGPPILIGGASPPAARRAARIADGFVPSIPELWDDYRAALVEAGKPDPGAMPPRGQAFHHISHEPEEAWARIAPYCIHEVTSYARWNAGSGAVMDYSSGEDAPVPALDADSVRAMGIYPVFTPKEAAAECRRLGDQGTFTLHPLCGGLPPAIAWESLRLFETEVLPELDG
jgi:alkanesulfonate monooxygenase SsuD/methylene tetrahydromethanopterin reductase-like flavin-dependent oxidoreductase (luciferase family)